MRLELIKRTLEAMVETDLAAVEQLATIAEEMAELFPKSEDAPGIDYVGLMVQMRTLLQNSRLSGYVPAPMSITADLPARSLAAYADHQGRLGVN